MNGNLLLTPFDLKNAGSRGFKGCIEEHKVVDLEWLECIQSNTSINNNYCILLAESAT